MRRSFLFLQGPCTPFFARLADHLIAAGHAVHRINFCAGDALYWGTRQSWRFNGEAASLRDFLHPRYERYGITDQIVFGDRRPVHRPAIEDGQRFGVRTHVFEEGYFRPWWVTLEREGVNGHSLLPRDPDWFRDVGVRLGEPAQPMTFASPFYKRATYDVIYHASGLLNPLIFSRYRTHAGVLAPLEYAAYIRRFARLQIISERERQRAHEIAMMRGSYYVLPLQLNTDAQIRDHSPFAHMGEVIEHVLSSFARFAPTGSQMVIKNHPLDAGLMNFKQVISDCEQRFGIVGRVTYLEDGDLLPLVANAAGVVTVNSTVGMVALEQGTPTLTLSDPIYNLPGLTNQQPLDDFWCRHTPPDTVLFKYFRRCVMHATQINGGFYCSSGIALAVEHSARVLCASQSPLELLQ